MKMQPLLFLILSISLLVDSKAELTEVDGLIFAKYGDRELRLDLFKPASQKEPLPAIVCIHGGGWRKGDRKSFGKYARFIAERNYVVVTIEYRLSGEAQFPAHIHDCKAAVRWLRANAVEFGIDPRRIGATGHSAGGHLAALLATSAGVEALEGDGGNPRYSSAIQAAVPMGAQSDFETDRIREMTAQPGGSQIWIDFLGGSLDEKKGIYQLASPRRHLDETDPPMMFITGALDNLDTHANPIRGDMREMEIPAGLFIIPDAPHNFLREPQWHDLALTTVTVFFDKYLKGAE